MISRVQCPFGALALEFRLYICSTYCLSVQRAFSRRATCIEAQSLLKHEPMSDVRRSTARIRASGPYIQKYQTVQYIRMCRAFSGAYFCTRND